MSHPKTFNCLHCDTENPWSYHTMNKYCNNSCQGLYQSREKIKEWVSGNRTWSGQVPVWARRYLIESRGEGCEICGITEWNGKHITLECDHIDGHHDNNSPENLRHLCPNCHSQTDTYKAKNKGNGRPSRR